MKNRILILLLAAGLCTGALGCGGSKEVKYADGTYEAKSSLRENGEDEDSEDGNGYGVVKLTIKDNKVVDCEYETYELDGTLKDENYGKKEGEVANRDYFNKAQKAVAACKEYANRLVSGGSLDEVDTISGATVNYEEFVEAVNLALDQAKVD